MSEVAVFDALKYRIEVDEYGARRYYNTANQLHRDGGPAVEYSDGSRSWWWNGLRHRIDGPAVELIVGGHMEWWRNGQRHRTDGPAVEWWDGDKQWYINGVRLTEAEFNQLVGAV